MTIRPVQQRQGSAQLSSDAGNGHRKDATARIVSSLPTYDPQIHFPPSFRALSPSAALRVLVSILCVCLSSIPICLTLNAAAVSSHPLSLLLVSVLILLCILALFAVVWWTLHSSSSPAASASPTSSAPPLFFFVFCLFSFSSFIDLLLCISAHGLHPLTAFYLQHGEPYLSSAHGAAINFWDGTVHLLCYLLSLYSMLTCRSYLALSLFWSGSILNSLIVLLSGAVVGYGSEIRWSVLLNVPYVVLPLLMAVRRWEQRDALLQSAYTAGQLSAPTRAAAALVIAATIAVHGVRSMAALCHLLSISATASLPLLPAAASSSFASSLLASYATDVEPMLISPSSFPLLQHLLLLFVSTPFLLFLLSRHVLPSYSPPPTSASLYLLLLHTGALAQAHGTFLLQSLFPFTLLPSMTDQQAAAEGPLLRLGMSARRAGLLTLVEVVLVVGNVWLCWLFFTGLRRRVARKSTR